MGDGWSKLAIQGVTSKKEGGVTHTLWPCHLNLKVP
jgi:hypothetical protein